MSSKVKCSKVRSEVKNNNNKKKIKIEGWIEENEQPKKNYPEKCPRCGSKLKYTNALQTCNIFLVYCMGRNKDGSMCRYCEEFKE